MHSSTRIKLEYNWQAALVLSLFFLAWHTQSLAASTYSTNSLETNNRSPLIQMYELPLPNFEVPLVVGKSSLALQLEIANYLSFGSDVSGEEFFIDGETWILSAETRHQLTPRLSFALQASLRGHGEGISDRFIFHFHDTLQLPQNGRTDDFHDRLLWQLNDRERQVFRLDSASSDPGDLRARVNWQTRSGHQWQAHVGLPLGDFDEQSGNEGLDIGLAWASQNPDWFSARSWLEDAQLAFWYGAGLGWISHPDQLAGLRANNWLATARAGLGWKAMPRWQLKIQLDSHSPLFNSQIRELGWIPLQISLASTHNFGDNTSFEFSLIEDLRPRVTPDIVFMFKLARSF